MRDGIFDTFLVNNDNPNGFLRSVGVILGLYHKCDRYNAEKILADEYTPLTFQQRIVLDNTICEYKNFVSLVEGLEKSNAGNR